VRLNLRDDLAFVTATLVHEGTALTVPNVLIDTGAASSVFNADIAAEAGISARGADRIRVLRGVGGREYVFVHRVDRLAASYVEITGEISRTVLDGNHLVPAVPPRACRECSPRA
jgi:hypothetical protein